LNNKKKAEGLSGCVHFGSNH